MPSLTLPSVLLVLAAAHSAGLGVRLARGSGHPRRARLCLAALTGGIAVLLLDLSLTFSQVALPWPRVRLLTGLLWLLVAPLFYGYVRFLLPERAAWQPEDALHLLPLALQAIVTAAFLWAPSLGATLTAETQQAVRFVFVTLFWLQSVAYAVLTPRLVAGYAARYRREAAGATADHLVGLQRFLLLFGVYVVMMTVNMVALVGTGEIFLWLDYLVPLALAALAWALGYTVLRRPDLVLPSLHLPERLPEPAATVTPEAQRHADALRALMETDRPYLDPEVRLADLARRLGTSERTLSHVLASALGGSFYDVVNGYRVVEAQARLADPALAHQTVLAVGLDAGFSSKASFNRVFKAATGETPSAYRRRTAGASVADGALGPAGGDGAAQTAQVREP